MSEPEGVDVSAYWETLPEQEFAELVLSEATANGWRVAYTPDWLWKLVFATWKNHGSRRGRSWAEPGFPDLVLVRPPELLVVELKAQQGTVREAQKGWLADLKRCGVPVYVWRPKDLDFIRDRLAWRGGGGE